MPQAHSCAQTTPRSEALADTVERVTFHNADTGFAVLTVKARGKRDLITIVGHAAPISAGPMRASRIVAGWADQKTLYAHEVGTARAVRIFKTYGHEAIRVVTEGPYRLARDVRG